MRVVDLVEPEQAFSEGEPDLESPEELAVAEMDDETVLEEELDNDDVAEEEVDDELLSATLEHLVHLGDDDQRRNGAGDSTADEAEELLESLETDELEDLEESLDRVLVARLASADDGEPDDADTGSVELAVSGISLAVVLGGSPCRAGEFVCRRCFLVRSVVQLADSSGSLCRDCAT